MEKSSEQEQLSTWTTRTVDRHDMKQNGKSKANSMQDKSNPNSMQGKNKANKRLNYQDNEVRIGKQNLDISGGKVCTGDQINTFNYANDGTEGLV